MTGGVVVVLGQVGRNVGAGMSGGLAYVYDPENEFLQVHSDNADNIFRVTTKEGEAQLKELIEAHEKHTGSTQAASILRNWSENLGKFWQVAPPVMQSTEVVGTVREDQAAGFANSIYVASPTSQVSLPLDSSVPEEAPRTVRLPTN